MFRSLILRVAYEVAVRRPGWRDMAADLAVWRKKHPTEGRDDGEAFVKLARIFPEFRTQIYYRLPRLRPFRWLIGEGMVQCWIVDVEIGPGLFIEHGWCTAVGVHRAGRNFYVGQEVTIGHGTDEDIPTIGDNVTIKAGAKVFGGITIGDNVVIGANAVVAKDVPSNCVVAGVPARIIRRNGVRCDEPLGGASNEQLRDFAGQGSVVSIR